MLAWDTETRSFRWWENPTFLGSWSNSAEGSGNVAALPLHTGDRAHHVEEFRRALLTDKHLIGANSKFDAHMTREALGIDVLADGSGYEVDDVLIMSRLWFGARRVSHGLKELTTDYINPEAMEPEKAMQARYHELTGRSSMSYDDAFYVTWQAFPEEVETYAGFDAVDTFALRDFFWPKITSDPKLLSLYRLEQKVQGVLYNAERIGVRVDEQAVERLTAHYRERDEAARAALQRELGFIPEGEGSEEALREALPRAGVPLTERTEKTGELAINRKALEPFSDHPAVAALFEFRRVHKFLSTYIKPMTDVEIVHPTFNQAQAWTGRMSGSNPNMQNLPKRTEVGKDENLKIRSVFIPREGMEFIIADYSSIEMYILAYFLGDPDYRKDVAEGDPHAKSAANAWGGTFQDYVKGTQNRWLRDIAKHTTYGIVYGGGGPVVMNTINRMVTDVGHPEYRVDLEQARAMRRKLTDAIPGFRDLTDSPWRGKQYPQGRLYQQLMRSQEEFNGKNYGYVRTLLGRKQWISLDKAYVALSGLIQGSAADVMKAAAVNVYEAMKPYGGYPLLFVHDEVLVEVPKGWGQRLMPIVVEAMKEAAVLDPALDVEAHVTDKSYAHSD